mmetsp:Transcript_12104/g.48710  ORF Transcript_12104/g.48710 Transcript_12104/m.48710 type:complete len:225 (+) Transcript_12104:955-1629(+)
MFWPWRRLVAMAISPIVMSAPKPLHTRLKGRFPIVVSGARTSLSSKSTFFFSAGRSFATTSAASFFSTCMSSAVSAARKASAMTTSGAWPSATASGAWPSTTAPPLASSSFAAFLAALRAFLRRRRSCAFVTKLMRLPLLYLGTTSRERAKGYSLRRSLRCKSLGSAFIVSLATEASLRSSSTTFLPSFMCELAHLHLTPEPHVPRAANCGQGEKGMSGAFCAM